MKLIIQIALIAAVLLCALYFLAKNNSKTQAWKKILAILFAIFAVIIIAFPDLSNDIANAVGVSRGADLILYALVIIVLFEMISNSLRRKDDQKRFAKVVRKMALMEKQIEDLQNEPTKKPAKSRK